MSHFLVFVLIGTILGSGLGKNPLAKQATEKSPEMALIQSVMGHRLAWQMDSTLFDACQVFEAVGSPADFPVGLEPWGDRLLDRPQDPCGAVPPDRQDHVPYGKIEIYEVSFSGDSARVVIGVVRRDRAHFEEFILSGSSSSGRWGVDKMEMNNYLEYTPIRREIPPNP
jgi:hypothetical protein